MLEHVRDLARGDAGEGKRRQVVFGEELGIGGFVAVLRGTAAEFAEEEKLVGMKGVRRMALKVAIENGGKFGDADFVTGFFAGFASGRDGGRLADVGPAAGKRPVAVLKFAHEEDAAIVERGDADVDFGGGVAGLLGEESLNERGGGKRGAGAHHFGGDIADFAVAVNIEFILAVGETGLRDGLESARPGEPRRNRHGSIVAAEGRGGQVAEVRGVLGADEGPGQERGQVEILRANRPVGPRVLSGMS